MKILIRATQNKQRGRMRPAGRQFDMPVLETWMRHGLMVSSFPDLRNETFN
jgi:hypothetical protein